MTTHDRNQREGLVINKYSAGSAGLIDSYNIKPCRAYSVKTNKTVMRPSTRACPVVTDSVSLQKAVVKLAFNREHHCVWHSRVFIVEGMPCLSPPSARSAGVVISFTLL